MKLFYQVFIGALSLLSTEGVQHQSDVYYHETPVLGPSMWHFGPDGLTIYAPNGDVLKTHRKKTLCKEYTDRQGVVNDDCGYFTMASDGHKYVWATVTAGGSAVQAFDIDTGDYAGSLETCGTPIDMEYHTARDEMFIRCAAAEGSEDNAGEIDVFSSATLSSDLPMVKFNATGRVYGRLAVHSSLGPIGYSLAYNKNYITEIDLSTKEVVDRFEIPDAYGGYDTTYSPVNQHLYFRSRVCCSCDMDDGNGGDVDTCGYGGSNVIVTTGPSKSPDPQMGICSGGCEGSPADTIGVVEFDTVNNVFVDSHNIMLGTGWGADVVSSPDGRWIVLFGNDGGQNVRVMEAGKNGESSGKSVRDIAVDFEGGLPGSIVVADVAFIQDENREIMIVGANSDNNIVLADLNSGETFKFNMAPGAFESSGGGLRNLEWAVGTDYVWVDGDDAKAVYILTIPGGIDSVSVERQLSDVGAGNMVFVNNYERLRAANAAAEAAAAISASNLAASAAIGGGSASASSSNLLGIIGIVLGFIGFVAGIGALVLVMGQKNVPTPESASLAPHVREKAPEDIEDGKTLGSKQVS